jgi:TolA-binding protein
LSAAQVFGQAPAASSSKLSPEEALIRNEVKFSSKLVRLGFPDYARKALDQLVAQHPAAKPAVAAGRIEALTAQGKFEEAEALIASMPPQAIETMTMRLAIGDRYYQWGKLAKASEMYETFFKAYPNGPPPEIRMFYEESAYKYSQMLKIKGDSKGALRALRLVLMAKPEADIKRQIQTDMVELLFKVGMDSSGKDREDCFKEATALCTDIQFKGVDIPFGKTVVVLAHIDQARGLNEKARKTINDYMPMLKQIDDYLRAEKLPLRDSPMAECRYLLGTLHEADGRAFYADKTKEQEALAQLQSALTQFYTVFLKYPASSWAPDAGKHAEDIVDFLASKGRKVQVDKPDMGPVVAAQLKEAKILFLDGNHKEAAEKYVDVLNVFPELPTAIGGLGDLGQCYAREKDLIFAKAVAGHLAERFGRQDATKKEAGNALLSIAQAYEDMGMGLQVVETYGLFLKSFADHEKFPTVLFRCGEAKMRVESYQDALGYFKRLVDECPKTRLYPDALSRMAYCQTLLGDNTNAIATLGRYVAELSPGPEKLAASVRLADAYRLSQQWVEAINEYARLLKAIAQEPNLYTATPEDAAKTAKVRERALFWKAFCYSRLRLPPERVGDYQAKAIEGYTDLLKGFPKSELAPSALSGMGTLYYLQNKPEDAGKAFDRLQKEFPNCEQAKNVLFAQGQSLLDIGQTEKAVEVFSRMFENAKAYTPPQFFQVGRIVLEAGQFEIAVKAYTQARTSNERAIWESASVGLAQAYAGLGKYKEVVGPLDELLAKYKTSGYTVQACLLLSRANAELAQQEPDAAKKKELFKKAVEAMNRVRDFAKDADVLANADVELAVIQLLMGKKSEGLASFQRLILLGDVGNPKVRPHIEKAFERSVPLQIEMQKWSDAMENCEFYLKAFPQGRLVPQAQQWRDQMILKGAKRAGAAEETAPAGPSSGGAAAEKK